MNRIGCVSMSTKALWPIKVTENSDEANEKKLSYIVHKESSQINHEISESIGEHHRLQTVRPCLPLEEGKHDRLYAMIFCV